MKLLFIHGAGGWSGLWWKQLEFFTDADPVSLPGHPDGSLLPNIEEYAHWLHQYIQERRYTDTVLVGHCLGGYISACYALTYPGNIHGLVISGIGHCPMKETTHLAELEEAVRGEIAAWLHRLRQHYETLPSDERAFIIGRYRHLGPLVQLSDLLCCQHFEINDHLKKLRVPTLVITGKDDIMIPIKHTKSLAKQIPGARQEVIKGANHQVFLEKPADYNRIISNFVEKLNV